MRHKEELMMVPVTGARCCRLLPISPSPDWNFLEGAAAFLASTKWTALSISQSRKWSWGRKRGDSYHWWLICLLFKGKGEVAEGASAEEAFGNGNPQSWCQCTYFFRHLSLSKTSMTHELSFATTRDRCSTSSEIFQQVYIYFYFQVQPTSIRNFQKNW